MGSGPGSRLETLPPSVRTPAADNGARHPGKWQQIAATLRLVATLRFVVGEFGPLIAFGLLSYAFGVRTALAGAVVAVIAGCSWRLWRRIAFTRIYTLASGLTVVFGLIDLFSADPFMLKYEAVITNVATGIAFVAGARGTKPMIQEFAEQRQGQPFPERADVRRFFELFTLTWAGYFFVKAACYLWIGLLMPLAEATAVRALAGGISLAVMLVVSITQGPRLFNLCHRLKLLPVAAPDDTDPTPDSDFKPGMRVREGW